MNGSNYPNIWQSLFLLFLLFLSFLLFFGILSFIPQLLGIVLPELYLVIVFSVASPICTLPLILYFNHQIDVPFKWTITLPKIHIVILLAILAICVKLATSPLNLKGETISIIKGRVNFAVLQLSAFDLKIGIRFLGSVLLTPIVEEIFWRKQILGQFLKRYSPRLSIVLTASLFAFCHLRLADVGIIFIWGLLFGYVYYKTKSIEISILLHSFANLSSFFIKEEITDFADHKIIYLLVLVICITVIVLTIRYFSKFNPSAEILKTTTKST